MGSNLLFASHPHASHPATEKGRLFVVTDRAVRPKPAATPRRLAPFQAARITPAASDAGLALFDAMPARRSTIAVPPLPEALPAPPQYQRWLARLNRRCPSCGWTDVRRSIAHNAKDYLLSLVGLVPYRCRTCSERFHRVRTGLRA